MKRGMRDAGHDSELLVRVGQPLEELHEVGKARDTVVLAAHDEGRRRDLRGIADRQIGAHIDIGAGRHGVVELEDGVGERLDDDVVGGAGMVALENRAHEFAVDRTPVLGAELGQPLAALGKRRGTFAGPYHGIEREPRDHLRVALREQGRAQRARRNPVDQKRALAAHLFDIARGREAVVGAVGDGGVVVAGLGGAAVALHVDAPGVVAAPREEIHGRGIGAPRHLQVEGRLRGHGRAVHEQDSAGGARGIAGVLVPQEQADLAALLGPVLLAAHDGGGRNGLVHYATPRS